MTGSNEAVQVLERFTWFEAETEDADAEVDLLLGRLDGPWQALLEASGQRKQDLIEIFLQLGRRPKAVFDNGTSKVIVFLTGGAFCERGHIDRFIRGLGWKERLGPGSMKSMCIPSTLHRISFITKGEGNAASIIGLNARVGRSFTGIMRQMCPWLVNSKGMNVSLGRPLMSLTGKSVLFIGRPGAGKTTLVREMARSLSCMRSDMCVVVVDKINEIAGDSESPHAVIGEARWMPCGNSELHSQLMLEAVQNIAPDVLIVDEICTAAEVDSVCSVADRGVGMIATVHGTTFVDNLNCTVRQSLLGGIQGTAAGTPRTMRSPGSTNGFSKRARIPAFEVAVELHQKDRWILHPNVRYAVDSYLLGEPIEALELRPGLAVATLGIPFEDGITYCNSCSMSRRCALHHGSRPPRSPSPVAASGALGRLPISASLQEDASPKGPSPSSRNPAAESPWSRGLRDNSPASQSRTSVSRVPDLRDNSPSSQSRATPPKRNAHMDGGHSPSPVYNLSDKSAWNTQYQARLTTMADGKDFTPPKRRPGSLF